MSTRTRHEHAIVTVSNTGPVIQVGEIERLLPPFQRLTGERTGHPDGHGLGLSIVAAIATAHGADLSIKAWPTGGLEVSVTLPRYRPPHGIAETQSASEPSRAILSTSAERH